MNDIRPIVIIVITTVAFSLPHEDVLRYNIFSIAELGPYLVEYLQRNDKWVILLSLSLYIYIYSHVYIYVFLIWFPVFLIDQFKTEQAFHVKQSFITNCMNVTELQNIILIFFRNSQSAGYQTKSILL